MKVKKIALLVVCLLVIGMFSVLSVFKLIQTSQVRQYLYSQGYNNEDIKFIRTKVGKAPLFKTMVIFKDEPEASYFYRVRDGEVLQFTHSVVEGVSNKRKPEGEYKHIDKR
ncbi:DUF3139 domain-containing protein [Paenibacillus oralis]|uniref:DUF3139 domain-containing protein n=1 Tax=Paenibacillus oralis TaxID=2490856 RepID=A0A3P3TXH9_9BACL|nr:DUF3139 domain-containing protein [Paenibacillus oralis]RRJ62550.1 DUF3139 domain-containing protein [Paenibacillus oralis]